MNFGYLDRYVILGILNTNSCNLDRLRIVNRD